MASHGITTPKFSAMVISFSADKNNNHPAFLKPLATVLLKVIHNLESLGAMIYYWHYLCYDMLKYLALSSFNLHDVQMPFEIYETKINKFRRQTTMVAFCDTEIRRRVCPPQYVEIVTQFQWSETDTLQRLEDFRMDYLRHYHLHSYSMILGFVERMETEHSFSVIWFVPHVIAASLTELPEQLVDQYFIRRLINSNSNLIDEDMKVNKVCVCYVCVCVILTAYHVLLLVTGTLRVIKEGKYVLVVLTRMSRRVTVVVRVRPSVRPSVSR